MCCVSPMICADTEDKVPAGVSHFSFQQSMKAHWWKCIIYTHCLKMAKSNPKWTEIKAVKTWQDPPSSCQLSHTDDISTSPAAYTSVLPTVCAASISNGTRIQSPFWKDMLCFGSVFILGEYCSTLQSQAKHMKVRGTVIMPLALWERWEESLTDRVIRGGQECVRPVSWQLNALTDTITGI